MFDGREWQSCEQAFQGFKSVELKFQEKIRGIFKSGSMNDSAHGMECWSAGQRFKATLRPDWYVNRVVVDAH